MKSSFIYLVSIALFIAGCETPDKAKNEFTLQGEVAGLEDSVQFTLLSRSEGHWVRHDSTMSDGEFQFKGSILSPELYFVQVGRSRSYITVFLENSRIKIDAENRKLDEATITGSHMHDLLTRYENDRDQLMGQARDIYYELEIADASDDEVLVDSLADIINGLYTEIDLVAREHMLMNTDNAMGPFLATQNYFNGEELEEADSVLNLFKGDALRNTYYNDFASSIAIWKRVAVGQPAPDWTQNDPSGEPVSFSDITAQYILIDFWASWCAPCRQENPNIVRLYEEYREKGLEIIGVSLDDNRSRWVEAIAQDDLVWYHVSDLKGSGNEVGELYGVKAIPHSVLIDPEGIIIAKDLRGDGLRAKLAELL